MTNPHDIDRPFRRKVVLEMEAVDRKTLRNLLVKSTNFISGASSRVVSWSILPPRKKK